MRTNVTRQFRSRERNVQKWERNVPVPHWMLVLYILCCLDYRIFNFIEYLTNYRSSFLVEVLTSLANRSHCA